MELLRDLRLRLADRADSEHEQALLRIAIVGLFLAYMAGFHGWPADWSDHDRRVVTILSAFLLIAIGIFAAICISPRPSVLRRLAGMAADCAGCTWYMWVAGDYGFFVIGVYLFITFGNGFRYGLRYLFGCQALCLAGLISNLLLASYWQQRQVAGIGLLIAMVVLPLYVSTLLKRIQEARARAEEANVAKTSFLANMSHEMRTPLNGIVGVVDLLRTTALSTQQVELVGLLRHSVTVLRSLVDDVLDITKIEAGRLTIEVVPFDLHASINELIQLLRPHAQAKGLALRASVDPALEYRLRGDPHHLRQVLLNLLGNAIKFTERGEVSLAVSLKQESQDGITARFEVKDSGIGISPESLPKIFERFVQADQSTTRKYGGTGLGTTIAKQLVELMSGNIGVESKVGEGSVFWFELPLLRHAEGAEDARVETADRSTHARAVTLVVAPPGSCDVLPALRSMGERYEVVTSTASVTGRLDALHRTGVELRAIIATCPVEQACALFNATVQRLTPARVALIYVANAEISVVDRARVNSIHGAYAIAYPAARLIANAIHATTAGMTAAAAESEDLDTVLARDRAALKVLVAEDNPTNQKIIRQLLERAGYVVVLACDGEEALDRYETESPDLGIFDFNMPQRSGIEVIQTIRAMEPPGERMPAIVLSASVTLEARERASKAGADAFVGKPFDAAALIRKVDTLGGGVVANGKLAKVSSARRPKPPKLTAVPTAPARAAEAEQSALDARLVDPQRLSQLEDIARDASFLGELIGGFASDVDAILTRTERAIASGDADALPDLMHSLKGAAVSVGATQLADLAFDFETSSADRASDSIHARLAAIRTCFDATKACLRSYLQTHHHV